MKRLFFLLSISMFCFINAYTQVNKERNFYAISDSLNDYYKRTGKKQNGYKQFKRWEWYYSTRVGAGGKMVNNQLLNQQALQASTVNRLQDSNTANVNTGGWNFVGPTNVNTGNKGIGRVNRMAFHPTDPDILYVAGASGGLWITPDAGANWYSYSEGIPNMCLSGVAVDYTNPNIIYILTGDGDSGGPGSAIASTKNSIGVLKSYDGGFTWNRTGLSWIETDQYLGYKLMMHPTNPSILLVATNDGIFRTTNGGSTWSQTNAGNIFYDIEFQPGNPSVVYASGNNSSRIRVLRSTDNGQVFTETFSITRVENAENDWSANRSALAVSPANNNFVYLLTGPCTDAGEFHGFYRSTDAAVTFTLRTNTPNILGSSSTGADAKDQEDYDLATVVSPTNINRVAVGGIKLWTSTNGGTDFSWQDDYVNSTSYYHADVHDLVYHPLDNSKLYMCGDGGVYISFNDGGDWMSLNNNLQLSQYYKISINPASGANNQNIMIGGLQDNGTNKRGIAGGGTFSQIYGADGMDCFIDPDNVNTYVVSAQDGVFKYSTNAGDDFVSVCDPESLSNYFNKTVEGFWVTPVSEITGSNTQFVMGYNPVIMATNIGSGFVFTELGWSGRTFVKTARTNANRIYVGDNSFLGNKNVVKTTTNLGNDWSTVLSEDHNGKPVTDLAFAPTNGNRIWLTFGGYVANGKVKYSSDGGSTWTDITGSLPNVPVNCIVYENSSGSNDGLYIGTDIGVFYRNNTLGDWIPFSNNLPVVEVTDLEIHNPSGLLRAGTYGRGIWETPLYSSCVADITLNTSNTAMFKPYYFQASQTITSTALHIGTGANVFYKAGTQTVLSPGFIGSANGGNVFQATLGPCGGGVPPGANLTSKPGGLRGFLSEEKK